MIKESKSVGFLYNTALGRIILKPLVSRTFSRLCGAYLSTPLSAVHIKRFIRKNGINLNEYEKEDYRSFNDFFTRKIKSELRPTDFDENALISPCDAKLSVYDIEDGLVMTIKESRYSVDSLLDNKELAEQYKEGICLVFRLGVDDYHRYCYALSGQKSDNVFIKGKLHTVRPIALRRYPVFIENCREYSTVENEVFGSVVEVEVGALLVGKIKNNDGRCAVKRGDEKGMFLFGGSTVVILLKKDKATVDEKIREASEKGIETPVKMGQRIGYKK